MDTNIYFPEGFLNEEIRNDWIVTCEMKKIWAISIALLEQVRIICENHNLEYFAIGGTAIGAIRHKGFIPWDDDIDIALKRPDYDKFIEFAKNELEYPFELQTTLIDNNFYNKNFARIRHSLSTGISSYDGKLPCNNGVFIDIMPLDSYEPSKNKAFVFFEKIKTQLAWNKIHSRYTNDHKTLRKFLALITPVLLGGSVAHFYDHHEKNADPLKIKGIHK